LNTNSPRYPIKNNKFPIKIALKYIYVFYILGPSLFSKYPPKEEMQFDAKKPKGMKKKP